MNFLFQKILSFIGIIILSILGYFIIQSFGTFSLGEYSVGEVQHQRNDENKSLISLFVNGEQFIIPLYVKNIEKQYFQFEKGEKIVFKTYYTTDKKPEYTYIGRYIVPYVFSSLLFFIGILSLFFGFSIFRPLITLGISLFFIVAILFPALLAGQNIYFIGFGGITLLVIFSILFTHGFSRASYISAFCSFIVLFLAYFSGEIIGSFFNVFGYAGSNISYFETQYPNIHLQGIFFIGIYLGIVGVIDDVTMAQSTAAEEIYKANPQYSLSQLYIAGMHLGKAHIFSMLNTLVFAYIGTSIPIYLYIMSLKYPFWVIINSTLFAEEFLRVLIALLALSLAIPITAFISSWWITKKEKKL